MPEAPAPQDVEAGPPPIPDEEPACVLLFDEHTEPCVLLFDEHTEHCDCCTHFAVDFDRMPELLKDRRPSRQPKRRA